MKKIKSQAGFVLIVVLVVASAVALILSDIEKLTITHRALVSMLVRSA